MAYYIAASVIGRILEMTFSGELKNRFHDRIVDDAIAVIEENKAVKVLIDISRLKGRVGITDAYSHVRNFPLPSYKMRFAMLNIHGQSDVEHFQETTALNAGLIVKWFADKDAARDWLHRT